MQFLSFQDYLLRNFNLFRLEATYEIQEDIHDVLNRVGAQKDEDGNVQFRGWARMAIPITSFRIIDVRASSSAVVVTGDSTSNSGGMEVAAVTVAVYGCAASFFSIPMTVPCMAVNARTKCTAQPWSLLLSICCSGGVNWNVTFPTAQFFLQDAESCCRLSKSC